MDLKMVRGTVSPKTGKLHPLSFNLTYFSTNVPDDSRDMKKKSRKHANIGKLNKVSQLQPRYKLDENINHANGRDVFQNHDRLLDLIANSSGEKGKVFKGTLGQNFLNISANDRKIFRQKMEKGVYDLEELNNRPSSNEPTYKQQKHGILQRNNAEKNTKSHKKNEPSTLFDFSRYSHFLKNRGDKGKKSANNSGLTTKSRKNDSKLSSKPKRPSSAPIKDQLIKKKSHVDRKTAKMFNNLIPNYKKSSKIASKGLIKGHFFKSRENPAANTIYTGPVIKKKMLG